MSFDFIKLGTSRKSYTHDKSFDNNTTMDFGGIQPLLSEYMLPDSDISVNARQLVRLAPMPTPSFARINLQNYARFVPISDVVPYHECLLSNKPYFTGSKSFVPIFMPYTTNQTLLYFLLSISQWCGYTKATTGVYSSASTSNDPNLSAIKTSFYLRCGFGSSLTDSTRHLALQDSLLTSISFEESDYLLYTRNGSTDYCIAFKFTPAALRARKIFVGLGYGLEFNDTNKVSLAPLLCFYKAYFDTFGLTRNLPYTSTNCFSLVRYITDYDYSYDMSLVRNGGSPNATPFKKIHYFWSFLHDLCNCYYTSANSFIAAHRSDVNNNAVGFVTDTQAGSDATSLIRSSTGKLPTMLAPSSGFTQIALDSLRRLTRFVSKDSAIGMRISDWVRVHYGAEVSNSLFEDSNFVSNWSTSINIDDVFSTSDTADSSSNDGEYLGSYAGKGLGFDKSSFKFHAKVHGYFFVFSAIVPVVHDFVGCDPTLYAISMNSIPIPEYDALGYEVTPRSAVVGDNFVSPYENKTDGVSFGFIPRYTGFKVKKDIINGQMYQGHFKRDLQPYYLDRLPYNNNLLVSTLGSSSSSVKVVEHFNSVPNASTSWQKLGLYNTMGNFNRLFYNEGSYDVGEDGDFKALDDNFIVQTIFDVKVKNFLKPVQDSYDTFSDEDNSSINEATN